MPHYNLIITYDKSEENTYKSTIVEPEFSYNTTTSLLKDEIELVDKLADMVRGRCRSLQRVCPTCGKTKDDPAAAYCSNGFHLDEMKYLFGRRYTKNEL
jgi:hypothetical protein